jgi:ApbE superfamily uncharacterized protein (UPF0280 family)
MDTDGKGPWVTRFYRQGLRIPHLISFGIAVEETDLFICADRALEEEAREAAARYRHLIEDYGRKVPAFISSLTPVPEVPGAPTIVREMVEAARRAGVGPMASVAGAVAEHVGKELRRLSKEVVVENGGDIFLDAEQDLTVGIFAGNSPLSGKIGIRITSGQMPLGVCTSSGTVGPSLSFGRSDAVTVLSTETALADAAATAIANRVKSSDDIDEALSVARKISGVAGAVVIVGERLGAWGSIELVAL